MKRKIKLRYEQFQHLYQNRHCYQENFDVFIHRRKSDKDFEEIVKLKGINFTRFKTLPSLETYKKFESVVIAKDIYVVGSLSKFSKTLNKIDVYSERCNK